MDTPATHTPDPRPRSSRWHPCSIGLSGAVFLFALAGTGNLLTTAGLTAAYALGLGLLGARPNEILPTIRIMLWMLPVTFFMHLGFTPEGWTFIAALTRGDLQLILLSDALRFTLQIFGFIYIMAGMSNLMTTERLLDAFRGLVRPLRRLGLNIGPVMETVSLGLRFFPVLRQESLRIREIHRGLGLYETQPLIQRIKMHLHSVIPLFIGTVHRAESIAQMMELRGYKPGAVRTQYKRLPWGKWDTIVVIGTVVLAGVVFAL